MSFQDSQDLVSSNTLDLWDSVRVTKNDTYLRWGQTLLRKLADGFINLLVHQKTNVKTNQKTTRGERTKNTILLSSRY